MDEHLRLAVEAGGLGTWRWDRASGRVEWDRRMEELYGIPVGSFVGTFEGWAALVHPDDRAQVLQVVEQAVTEKAAYRLEHRTVPEVGEVRWLEGSGRVLLDAAGEVAGSVGCSYDVTERVLAQIERERLTLEARAATARERVQRQRLELVAAINDALEPSDDLGALLERVASTAVPQLGDWCTLHVLEPGSVEPLVATAHVDPSMVAYARELQERFPYDPDAPTGIAKVIRTGEAEFHPDITPKVLEGLDASDEALEVVRSLALRSAIAVPLQKQGRVYGAMRFVMTDEHRRYTHDDLTLAQSVAARIAASLENRRLRELRDRTGRIDARLATVGRRLAGAHDVDEVLQVIGEEVAGAVGADLARVALIEGGGRLVVRGGGVGAGDGPLDLPPSSPVLAAIRDREIVFAGAASDGHEGAPDASGSIVASPLYDDERRPIGVLIMEWAGPQSFDDVDENAAETVSRLCGQALRRAQITGHTEELASIASSMASARTVAEVARLLRDHAMDRLGATLANLRVLDPETSTLEAVIPAGLPAALADRYRHVRLSDPIPVAEAVRADRSIWLPDLDAHAAQYGKVAEEARSAGFEASAAIPLHRSDGTRAGAVTFSWPTTMSFDAELRSRLATLCDLAAQTLERAMLQESEHVVVASLQRRLLAPLPSLDGLELAAHYQPASAAVGMGGDWYEAVPLADGSLVAVVGDVVGHGVDAIAAMAQLQHLLTGLIRGGTPLPELLSTTNAMLIAAEPVYATAVLLHVDPANGRLGYLSAGHPWSLLRHPDGSVEALTVRRHTLLGTRLTPQPLEYVAFPPGSSVLAYTDGLIERRDEAITEGIERLRRCVAAASFDEPTSMVLEGVVAAVRASGDDRTATNDDTAALLIRSVPRPTGA